MQWVILNQDEAVTEVLYPEDTSGAWTVQDSFTQRCRESRAQQRLPIPEEVVPGAVTDDAGPGAGGSRGGGGKTSRCLR